MKNTATDFDVLIVGAGISGIGMAAHMKDKAPGHSFAIVERRDKQKRMKELGGVFSDNKHGHFLAIMITKLEDLCDGSFNGKIIAMLGVTFKPDTDDMRDAPALTIVPALVGGGAQVSVVDPQGRREGEALLPGVRWEDDPYAAAEGADLLLILTEWNEFRALDLGRIASSMATARLADLRNIYSASDAEAAGFVAYDSIGRTGYGR